MTRIAPALLAAGLCVAATTAHAQKVSCKVLGNLRSIDSGQAISLTIVNRSGGFRHVDWIDYNGNPVNYANLNPGQSYTQQTFVGHPWMATDGPGNCRQLFVPERSGRFIITR